MVRFGSIVAGFLFAATAAAQVGLPATPAGRYLTEFLEVYNSADPQRARELAGARLAPDLLAALGGREGAARALGLLRSEVGPLEPVDVEERGPTSLLAFAHGSVTDTRVRLEVETDAGTPARVVRQSVAVGEAPPDAERLPPLGDAALAPALDAYLSRLSRQGYFSGVVLVAHHGIPVFRGAYGPRNEAGEALTPDSRFALASAGKMFTAVAVATLVESGKLAFDDPVDRYLPEVPADLIAGVTVAQLLSHTSGLGDFDFREMAGMRSVGQMLTLEVERTPYAPGERFAYSNMGYVLLGAVIERVSGERYDAYLRSHLFEPLGMHDTGLLPLSETTPGYATGFVLDLEAWLRSGETTFTSNRSLRVSVGSPAGDILSTAPDLLRFTEGLVHSKPISADTFRLMIRPREANYGYGFQTFPPGTVGHSGGARGESTHVALDLERGYTVIVLSNHDRGAGAVVRHLDRLLGF